MNIRPLLTVLVIAVISSGCKKVSPSPITLSADNFYQAFLSEVKKMGEISLDGSGSGRSQNIVTKEFSFVIPSDKFDQNRLYDTAKIVMDKFDDYRSCEIKCFGGGENKFYLNYGSEHHHAFIDIVAYPNNGKTEINCQIRVIE